MGWSSLQKLRAGMDKLYDPVRFQGNLRHETYFEGWYYKLVSADRRHAFAFIPGVSLDRDRGERHCFIQVIDGNTARTDYFSFSLQQFSAAVDRFEVRIAENRFTSDTLKLNLDDGRRRICGEIQCSKLVPWPSSLLRPGIMGWYSFMPFMECYHGLVSMNHLLAGEITIDGNTVSLSGGRGYTEKDWGTSFPRGYVWMQSNHFEDEDVSFMASVARIPWVTGEFTGFLAVLWQGGRLHVFTTYTKAKLDSLTVEAQQVTAVISDRAYRLELVAKKNGTGTLATSVGGVLKSPTKGAMTSRIAESLNGTLRIRLFERVNQGCSDNLIWEGTGRRAGVEIETTSELLGY